MDCQIQMYVVDVRFDFSVNTESENLEATAIITSGYKWKSVLASLIPLPSPLSQSLFSLS